MGFGPCTKVVESVPSSHADYCRSELEVLPAYLKVDYSVP